MEHQEKGTDIHFELALYVLQPSLLQFWNLKLKAMWFAFSD